MPMHSKPNRRRRNPARTVPVLRREAGQSIRQLLAAQLHDQALAGRLTDVLDFCCLQWSPPVVRLKDIAAIVACSFGYRRDPATGNLLPGPMNEGLAEAAVKLWQRATKALKRPIPVHAQWEIRQVIGDRIPDVYNIPPTVHPTDYTTVYLSTADVLKEAIKQGLPHCQGQKVAVVGWSDHAPRIIQIAHSLDIDAGLAPMDLPGGREEDYDAKSGQPWTTSRFAYLFHDMLHRMNGRRRVLIGTQSPSGKE